MIMFLLYIWHKHYRFRDHLGNERRSVSIPAGGAANAKGAYDYEPYCKRLTVEPDELERTGFIGKERDAESQLSDHGVRKYDPELGRFTMSDPLWEKYYGWTPWGSMKNITLKIQ